jgi:hypothetical protein
MEEEEQVSETTPFGDYLKRKIQETDNEVLKSLLTLYEDFTNTKDIK